MTKWDHMLRPKALELLDRARSSPPARRVNNGGGNIMGFFPSAKTRRVLQVESRLELLHAIRLECDPEVIEFYDQACRIPITMPSKQPRGPSSHVPDWLVLTRSGLELQEVKPRHHVQTDPRVPAVTKQARSWGAPMGITYRIVTEEDLPEPTELANLQFLVAFRFAPHNLPGLKPEVLRIARERPGLVVADLATSLAHVEDQARRVLPCIWHLVVTRELQMDWRQELIRPGSERRLRVSLPE